MRTYLRIILDVIFPPTVHDRLLRQLSATDFLAHYQPIIIKNVIALAPYSSRTVQAAVAACKFEKNIHAANLLGCMVEQWFSLHTTVGTTILIPIPLSTAREAERGFNQVSRVLESIQLQPDLMIKKNWLIRTINTTRQTSLGRAARLRNMTGAFATTVQMQQTDWNSIGRVIICDDVMTTGTTLEAARTELRKVAPRQIPIICLVWAH